ncbi:hypothetical protein GCWU000246_01121 [Jonquetella anthropi E3_33 E1]|nr:hypothetical protein GCWU000246_01121 [Jonquetella anthropi E3_33 E1]
MTSQGNSAAGSLSYLRKYLKAADIFIFVGRIFFCSTFLRLSNKKTVNLF